MYSPSLGRFMQTDPVGYKDGPNWYAYVHNDPVNGSDASGLYGVDDSSGGGFASNSNDEVTVTANRCPKGYTCDPFFSLNFGNPALVTSSNPFGVAPQQQQNVQQCSSGPARQYGISYSGNLFGILGGASLSVTIGVSIPTSGAGAQAFVGGEFDPLVGLGVNGGTSIGPTFGHSPTAVETGFNPTGSHIEGGAGLAYGAGVAQTVLPDGSVSTSIGFSGPPLPALKAGAYVGAGPAYSGQVATPQLGCHKG